MCVCASGFVCVCVFALCGQSVCVMNSQRDSRAAVKGVSFLAHHTSLSHFQTEELCRGEEKLCDAAQIKSLAVTASETPQDRIGSRSLRATVAHQAN